MNGTLLAAVVIRSFKITTGDLYMKTVVANFARIPVVLY